jgi:Tfp pilus assembly protein PilX
MTNKLNKNERGFALPLVLLLLVVMTIMGMTLVTITSNEHKANTDKDVSQQSFYAAESGIAVAKKWMMDNTSTLSGSQSNLETRGLKFCKASFFPNLKTATGFHFDSKSLNQVISASGDEAKRLSKFSFEYFITYSPNSSGVPTIKTKTVASTEGSSVTQGTAYKSAATSSATYYTIYSCGCNNTVASCNAQNNIIIPLEAVVALVKE